ncbi:hypothetical protein F2Q69_00044086 [Brassica cretica]|uniref:Uncharacterized protein n=1 Tax=Brassica cretica TaxID=69181 RepID=A0A8S9NL33_BRACR|nr:hypothetical protein F2Q69_00044086 [Brassica cretica]
MVLVNYPIILTKTLQLGYRKKHSRTSALDSIPEYESGDSQKGSSSELDFQPNTPLGLAADIHQSPTPQIQPKHNGSLKQQQQSKDGTVVKTLSREKADFDPLQALANDSP